MINGRVALAKTCLDLSSISEFSEIISVIFCGVCRGHFVISTLWPLTSNMLFVFLFSKYSSHCPSDMSLTCLVFVVNFLSFLQNWFESLMLLSNSFLQLSLYYFSSVKIKCLYRLPVKVSVTIQT